MPTALMHRKHLDMAGLLLAGLAFSAICADAHAQVKLQSKAIIVKWDFSCHTFANKEFVDSVAIINKSKNVHGNAVTVPTGSKIRVELKMSPTYTLKGTFTLPKVVPNQSVHIRLPASAESDTPCTAKKI